MEQPGSFSCACNVGYRLQSDGRSCSGKGLLCVTDSADIHSSNDAESCSDCFSLWAC